MAKDNALKCPHCEQPIDITQTILTRMGSVKQFIELADCSTCFSTILVEVIVNVKKN